MSNKSIGTIATMGIDIGKNSFRGAGGSLPPDSCRPMPMARTAELGQERRLGGFGLKPGGLSGRVLRYYHAPES
jgi:hypothetical protein